MYSFNTVLIKKPKKQSNLKFVHQILVFVQSYSKEVKKAQYCHDINAHDNVYVLQHTLFALFYEAKSF